MNVDAEEPLVGYNPANRVDFLNTVDSQGFIKKVKSNVNSRVGVQNKILRRIIRKYKSESGSETGKIVLSDGHSGSDDFSSLLQQHSEKIDNPAPLAALEGDEDIEDTTGIVSRKRRGVLSIFKQTFAFVLASLLFIVNIAIWLTIWILKILIVAPLGILNVLIMAMTGLDGGILLAVDRGLGKAWRFKIPTFPNV